MLLWIVFYATLACEIRLFLDIFCSLSLLNCTLLNEYDIIYLSFLLSVDVYHFCFYKQSWYVHFCICFLVQMCTSFSRIQTWERTAVVILISSARRSISPWVTAMCPLFTLGQGQWESCPNHFARERSEEVGRDWPGKVRKYLRPLAKVGCN